MSNAPEKRDPDEVILTPYTVVDGDPIRIPVVGRVGNGAQPVDDGEPRELSEAELAAAGLLDLDDEDDGDEDEGFNFSIEASLQSNHIAWRDLYELKGALGAMPDGPAVTHARNIADALDGWFDSQDLRLKLMRERRDVLEGEQ